MEKQIKIDSKRRTFNDEEIDITIIEIKPKLDKIKNFLEVDEDIFSEEYENNQKKREIYLL